MGQWFSRYNDNTDNESDDSLFGDDEETLTSHASQNNDFREDGGAATRTTREEVMKQGLHKYRKRALHRWSTIDNIVVRLDYNQYHYPFENLAFEGGGAKGYAFIGAVQILEETGLNQQIRRVTGSSIGCVTAAFFAVGCTSQDLIEFSALGPDIIFDNRFGILSLLPNLITNYGWVPGNRSEKLFGDVIARKTGNPDMTFKQLYEKTGMELCIPASNLNTMTADYFHVKTSPNMPIKTAMRLSISIPGLVAPKEYKLNGQTSLYVDGGLTCNFPIYAYDGWWLSLKPENSFLNKLSPISRVSSLMDHSERFGTLNPKTVGFLLYSNVESDPYQDLFESRRGAELPAKFQDTKLYRKYRQNQKLERRTAKDHKTSLKAIDAFFSALKKHDTNNDQRISLKELKAAFADRELFKREHADYLFGPDAAAEDVFSDILTDGDDEIDFHSLTEFIEKSGIELQSQFLGYRRRTEPINSFFNYCNAVLETALSTVERHQIRRDDVGRTVGINTGYVTSFDFVLEQGDRDFLIRQGRQSMEAFLRYYVHDHNLPKRRISTYIPSPSLPENVTPFFT